MSFLVLGAGVVGLSTALELQKSFPNASITIAADKFGIETTSDVAAGIFRPGPSFAGPTEDITRRWMLDSYDYWDQLWRTVDAEQSGVKQLSVYAFSSINESIVRNHFLEGLLPIYRMCTADELKLCNGNWQYGAFYTTLLTESRLWQAYAKLMFENRGGKILRKYVKNFNELNGKEFDVVFNCTGLGAQELCNDNKVVPIRGQIIKVHAPWIETAFYVDYDTYIIPGFNGTVTLGGTRQYESYNLSVDKYDRSSIRQRCEAIVPSLCNASVVRDAVGLRPYRSNVRVEMDMRTDNNGNALKVVHNYGHGGYGVTTCPGTAVYAVNLARDLLKMTTSKL